MVCPLGPLRGPLCPHVEHVCLGLGCGSSWGSGLFCDNQHGHPHPCVCACTCILVGLPLGSRAHSCTPEDKQVPAVPWLALRLGAG